MGFFFSQQKKAVSKRGGGPRNAPATKQNAAILNRLGCAACPLNNANVQTPKMKPTLAKETLVYFLAEAPGKHEDETSGKPLTGPSGKLLRECIPEGDDQYCSFDNTVRDRPPENRTPTWSEIESCRNHVTKSIEEAKPKLIVGLGIIPLTWMLHSTDMSGMRGRVFAVKVGNHQCWFMPTYHPSFILHIAYDKKKPLNSKMGHCFRMDVKKAFRLADKLPPAVVDSEAQARAGVQTFDGGSPDHFKRTLGLLKAARAAPIKAVDLETNRLRPYATHSLILTAAVSFGDTHFSFAVDHPKSKWTKIQLENILYEFGELLKDDTIKIAHNTPFELEWLLRYFGLSVVNPDVWECTQMQAHFIDERRGKQAQGGDETDRRATYQSLDFLCKQHFGIAYKSYFKLDKKNMEKADLGETLVYNAVDTKYTLRLYKRQQAFLLDNGLLEAYEEAIPRQTTVALMQHLGIGVDQAEVKKAQDGLKAEIGAINAEIESLKVIQAYKKDHKEFNPLSGPDLLSVFRDYLKRPEIKLETTSDREGKSSSRFSLDKNVLDTIDHPLAKMVVRLRNRTKLKSTYVDCFELDKGASVWPDSKIHTNFNCTFAETGRTSSDEPNQQNWPKRNDAWVRRQVTAGKGNVILAFDYGQLEGCTGAMCSLDKVLVKALWEDYDIHMEWTHKLVDKYPLFLGSSESMKDKGTAKKYRAVVKNKLVFPAIFGAQNVSIAGYLSCPVEIIDDLMDEFWATFRGLKNWQDNLMKGYYESGYVESPTGRRHHYPLTRNQAINFPIQGVAADIVCDSMNKLSHKAMTTGLWHLHPILNIHDDLTMIVPDDDKIIEESIETIYRIMLSPTYAFINVPLSVECSIGKNWAPYDKKTNPDGMQDIGKFWSHKDL